MKILITGGAGYIGTELVKVLGSHEKVKEICVYDNLSRKGYSLFTSMDFKTSAKTVFMQKDILDTRALEYAVNKVDCVIHLAAQLPSSYQRQDLHTFEQINHWGTAELVRIIQKSSVSKVIFISSVDVYGHSVEELTEESELDPLSAYGFSKMKAEKQMELLWDERKTIIIRSARVFGFSQGMNFESVINKFAFDARYQNRIAIHGSGTQIRPFISVKNLVKIIIYALFNNTKSEIWNAVDQNIQINVLAQWMKEVYPNLEVISLCQDLQEISLSVRPHPILKKLLHHSMKSFKNAVCNLPLLFKF